jgi:hypothetical protein
MAVVPTVTVHGTRELQLLLARGATEIRPKMRAVVDEIADDLLARIKRNASGRPGPDDPTGEYRESWRVDGTGSTVNTVVRSVGTDQPQAMRLEVGFVGPDALGRVYDQPPYPHMNPAVDEVAPVFYAAMAAVAAKAMSW